MLKEQHGAMYVKIYNGETPDDSSKFLYGIVDSATNLLQAV